MGILCPASAAGSSTAHADNPGAVIAEQVIRIDVPKDRRTFDSNPQAPRKHLIRQMVIFAYAADAAGRQTERESRARISA
jgi:hypothetical protein